jgi:hypothetical protein
MSAPNFFDCRTSAQVLEEIRAVKKAKAGPASSQQALANTAPTKSLPVTPYPFTQQLPCCGSTSKATAAAPPKAIAHDILQELLDTPTVLQKAKAAESESFRQLQGPPAAAAPPKSPCYLQHAQPSLSSSSSNLLEQPKQKGKGEKSQQHKGKEQASTGQEQHTSKAEEPKGNLSKGSGQGSGTQLGKDTGKGKDKGKEQQQQQGKGTGCIEQQQTEKELEEENETEFTPSLISTPSPVSDPTELNAAAPVLQPETRLNAAAPEWLPPVSDPTGLSATQPTNRKHVRSRKCQAERLQYFLRKQQQTWQGSFVDDYNTERAWQQHAWQDSYSWQDPDAWQDSAWQDSAWQDSDWQDSAWQDSWRNSWQDSAWQDSWQYSAWHDSWHREWQGEGQGDSSG